MNVALIQNVMLKKTTEVHTFTGYIYFNVAGKVQKNEAMYQGEEAIEISIKLF